ncbi:hypothetical protein Y032_0037g3442 [Ancylostoma ceylanicum]|uniref:Uncharacterized protein n=1 Tax=Ancylostoma ceylanicum TaxID=53326 RepID=A0A016UK55_9BILA|nr:hypothetical protein Y032_0037g3442 [Ancylostoma ceylanicum]
MLMVPRFFPRSPAIHSWQHPRVWLSGRAVDCGSNSRKSWAAPLAITCPDGSIGRASDYQSGARWFESGGDPKCKGHPVVFGVNYLIRPPRSSSAWQG